MKNRPLLLFLAVFVSCTTLCPADSIGNRADSPPIVLSVKPIVDIPLGSDSNYYRIGGGVHAGIAYRFLEAPALSATAGLGYFLAPLQVDTGMSMLPISGGLRLERSLTPGLGGAVFVSGGYGLGFLNDGSGSGGAAFLSLGGDLALRLGPGISLGAGLEYRNFLGLYNDLSISLGSFFRFQPGRRAAEIRRIAVAEETAAGVLQLEEVQFARVFPAFFKYYDEHPLGTAILTNNSQLPVERLKIQLFVKQYMDNPMPCRAPQNLEPGESGEIVLYGLFTDQVLYMYEGSKVSVNITAGYTVEGRPVQQEFIAKLRLYDRNAITWDDDRRVAAFVTSKDSTILRFAKNVSGLVQSRSCQALGEELQLALALHEALRVYGLNYMVDPTTPYAELSQQETDVDFIQFPRQTLEFKGGDCDDLSVLYCALLESVGIETAFITVPAHIYMAFALDLPPSASRECFRYPEDLIFQEGKAWVPLEITRRGDGFLDIWRKGAEQWREYAPAGRATLYPVHACWQEYEPVGFVETTGAISMPSLEEVAGAIEAELQRVVDAEIADQVSTIRDAIRAQGEQGRLINRLGVLYARYGMYREAEQQFLRALERQEYGPALINMGNLCFLRGEPRKALSYYERAAVAAPENPELLINLMRTHLALGNREQAAAYYDRLEESAPQMAEQVPDPDAAAAGRAAGSEERMVWQEE